ncbi:MAG: M3 family oligoendopeptidase [Thermomicrobiales bacterium]
MPLTCPTPDAFAAMTWPEIAPLYDVLEARPLAPGDAAGIETWLADWNALDESLLEAIRLAEFQAAGNTADPEVAARADRLSGEIAPERAARQTRLAETLLATGYTRPDLETTLRRFRSDAAIFRAENVPLASGLERMRGEYRQLAGGLTVEWDGVQVPVSRLAPMLQSPDRAVRERAWRLGFAPYVERHDAFAECFDRMLATRQQMARNAGFPDFRAYQFRVLHRFDYTPEDCERFHAGVEQAVIPAIRRRLEKRRQAMGLDTLRPWDVDVDPQQRPALTPFASIEELETRLQAVFTRVDPVFGEQFAAMRASGLLDLDARTGKAPGGFCDILPRSKRPYIFMSAAGTGLDVRILAHEAGHGFHGLAASALPFVHQRFSGEEMEEVGSMTMELLTAPFMRASEGGFYDEADWRRDRIEHLEMIVDRFAWIATVDAFQHWLYTSPDGGDRDARNAMWLRTWDRFNAGVDMTGLDAERIARSHRQIHLFHYPFYSIEYGLAQLAALQVWRNARTDWTGAIAAYGAAMALGGSRPLPELYARAGARLVFDAEGMAEMIALVEAELEALEAE